MNYQIPTIQGKQNLQVSFNIFMKNFIFKDCNVFYENNSVKMMRMELISRNFFDKDPIETGLPKI